VVNSMPTSIIDDPEHWRNRARQARILAEQMEDENKQIMLRVAEDYEGLAKKAEQRSAEVCPNTAKPQ
jgi:hypothetical protein